MFIQLRTPKPTTVSNTSKVDVRIILTEMLGPALFAMGCRNVTPDSRGGSTNRYNRLQMDVPAALTQFLEQFKRVNNAIVDSYFIVDTERRIVDFNRAFYAMLPRQVARGLKGKKCYEVIELNICKSDCIAQQCWNDNRHVRLDEISGMILGDSEAKQMRFILSA